MPGRLIVVERGGCDALHVDAHGFGLLEDALQAINQVLVVIVTLIDIKDCQDIVIFILDELLEELDIVWISEVVTGKHVDLVHQVLFALWQGTLRSLEVSTEGL